MVVTVTAMNGEDVDTQLSSSRTSSYPGWPQSGQAWPRNVPDDARSVVSFVYALPRVCACGSCSV